MEDSENVKKKADDAEENAKKAKDDEDAKKAKDEKDKAEQAKKDAEAKKKMEDSENIKKKADEEARKQKEDSENAKKEKSKESRVKDALSKLLQILSLLGIIGLIISIIPPEEEFCKKNPSDPKCKEPDFCKENPSHPKCKKDCINNPTDPRCLPIIPICPGSPGCDGFPPPPPPPEEEEESTEPAEAPSPDDSEGKVSYLVFTLQSEPENDLSFTLESNTDNLQFDDNDDNATIITFPKSTWDTPISVPFYITLDLDINLNSNYSNLSLDESIDRLITTKPKKIDIKKESLDKYGPTQKDIDNQAARLKYLLTDDSNYEKAINEIQARIRFKKKMKLLENQGNIYFNDIQQYGGDIEPVYNESDYKQLDEPEPVYHESRYKPYIKEDEPEPVYPEYRYKPYIKEDEPEPPYDMIGGQEYENSEYENSEYENSEYENSEYENLIREPEEIIDNVDYNKLSEDVDPDSISEDYTSLFTMTAFETPTQNYDIDIKSVSPEWKIYPDTIYFNSETGSNQVAIYATNTFNALKDIMVADKASDLTDEFNSTLENTYENEYASILQNEKNKEYELDNIYEDVYGKTLEEDYEDIALREQVLNEYINRQEGGRLTRKKKIKMSSQTRKIRV